MQEIQDVRVTKIYKIDCANRKHVTHTINEGCQMSDIRTRYVFCC